MVLDLRNNNGYLNTHLGINTEKPNRKILIKVPE